MIGYLSGKIVDINENKIIVLVNGVGYEVSVAGSFLIDEEVNLFIVTEVREDALDLFGFKTNDEKLFYKQLRSISGIGPRTAINLLSIPVAELKDAIQNEDMKKLTSVNGLGKKTAERMILELKNKLPDSLNSQSPHRSINENAMTALKNLGYKNSEINSVLSSMPADLCLTEDIVKFFLKNV